MITPQLISRSDIADIMRKHLSAEVTEEHGRDWRRVTTIVADQTNSTVDGPRLDFHMFEFCRSGRHRVISDADLEHASQRDAMLVPGATGYAQCNTPIWQQCFGHATLQQVYIDDSIFRETAAAVIPGDADRIEFLGFQGQFAPGLRALGDALLDEARGPQMGSDLQAEMIAQQMALMILRRRLGGNLRVSNRRKLSPAELTRVVELIEEDLAETAGLERLAGAIGMDPFSFTRAFKETTGQSPHQFLIERRLVRIKDLLIHSTDSLADIAYATGFSSQPHMTAAFSKHVGRPPGAYRKAHRG